MVDVLIKGNRYLITYDQSTHTCKDCVFLYVNDFGQRVFMSLEKNQLMYLFSSQIVNARQINESNLRFFFGLV